MANLANPIVVVNGETIEIRANTWKHKKGAGDMTVRTQQAGTRVTTVGNIDTETKKSMVGFELNTTAANEARKDAWLEARKTGGVTIEAFDEDNSLAFSGMYLLTEPETSGGAEGIIACEFEGPPIA